MLHVTDYQTKHGRSCSAEIVDHSKLKTNIEPSSSRSIICWKCSFSVCSFNTRRPKLLGNNSFKIWLPQNIVSTFLISQDQQRSPAPVHHWRPGHCPDQRACIFDEDVAFAGVFRCTVGLAEKFGNGQGAGVQPSAVWTGHCWLCYLFVRGRG